MNDLFANKHPRSVQKLLDDLKILIDQRDSKDAPKDSNVVSLHKATGRKKNKDMIRQYQQLAGPVAEYFFKHGENVTFDSYLKVMRQLLYKLDEINEQDQ